MNEIGIITEDNSLISEARSFYEKEVSQQAHPNTNARVGKKRHLFKRNLAWSQAKFECRSFGDAIIVPVNYKEKKYIPKGSSSISLDQLTYAVFYRDKNRKFKAELVTTIPDDLYLEDDRDMDNFSGFVLVESWQGKLLNAFSYDHDGINSVIDHEIGGYSNTRKSAKCVTIDYFTCIDVIIEGELVEIECRYDYSETIGYCPGSGGGELPPIPTSGVPTSGGSGADDYPPGDGTGTGDSGGSGDSNPPRDSFICAEGLVKNENGNCEKELEILELLLTPEIKIPDMKAYLDCFDTSDTTMNANDTTMNAIITVYVDQPIAGSSDAWAVTWTGRAVVGHTFVSISQGSTTSVFGFYPASDNTTTTSLPEPSVMGDDSGEIFDASISITVSVGTLKQILKYAINYDDTYDLSNYNCSDFGIAIGNLAGLNLPDAYGTWPTGINSKGGGSNPGALGQHIKNTTPSGNISTNTSGGKAPSNNKGC